MEAIPAILQQALLGAAVGYGTNWLAIRLLFRPYRRVKIGPFSFGPGVFVRHQEKLAREVARIAAESILTVDTLKEKLASPELKDFFLGRLSEYFSRKAEEEWGPLSSLVPDELRREYRELVLYARGRLREEVDRFIESEDFEKAVVGAVKDILEYHGRRKVGEIFTAGGRSELVGALHRLVVARLTDPSLEPKLADFAAGLLERFLENDRPLGEMLPKGLAAELESLGRGILCSMVPEMFRAADFEPLAEEMRALLKRSVKDFLDPERGSLFKRLVNRTIGLVKGEDIEEALNRFADGLPEWLVSYLSSPEGVEHLERAWQRGFAALMAMSPAEIAARLEPRSRKALVEGAGRALTSLFRKEKMSAALAEYIEEAFSGMEEETPEDVIRRVSASGDAGEVYEAAARFVLERMREHGAKVRLEGRLSLLLRGLLERPVGKPSRFLPPEALSALAGLVNDAVFDYVSEHSAQLIRSLELEDVIYTRIAAWDPRELHMMVERAARENLRRLEVLGGLIGFAVGTLFGAAKILL